MLSHSACTLFNEVPGQAKEWHASFKREMGSSIGVITGHAAAAMGRIVVTSATLGQNCGARRGNVTAKVAAICDGKQSCALPGSKVNNPDPAFGCAKTFAAEWKCTGSSATKRRAVPAAVNETRVLRIGCQ